MLIIIIKNNFCSFQFFFVLATCTAICFGSDGTEVTTDTTEATEQEGTENETEKGPEENNKEANESENEHEEHEEHEKEEECGEECEEEFEDEGDVIPIPGDAVAAQSSSLRKVLGMPHPRL